MQSAQRWPRCTGKPPKLSTGGGTSDGRFIATMGAQVVELGVTNASIHKVNESVAVEEIEALHRHVRGNAAAPARLSRLAFPGAANLALRPVDQQAREAQQQRTDEHPAGHRQAEEGPVDLGALA